MTEEESVCEIFFADTFCYSKNMIICKKWLDIHGKGEICIYSQNDTFTKILILFET